MKIRKWIVGLVVLALGCGLSFAGDSWIHVRVESGGEGDETVRVNIPFSLAEAVLPMVRIDQLVDGKLKIEGIELAELDLPLILAELEKSADGDFVNVRDGNDTVTVSKQGQLILINVDEARGETQVRVRLPLGVVEALLGDDGDMSSLDLAAAMSVLGQFEGELVSVRDGRETVRVWIDENNSMIE